MDIFVCLSVSLAICHMLNYEQANRFIFVWPYVSVTCGVVCPFIRMCYHEKKSRYRFVLNMVMSFPRGVHNVIIKRKKENRVVS